MGWLYLGLELFTIGNERSSARQRAAQEPERIDIREDSESRMSLDHGLAVRV